MRGATSPTPAEVVGARSDDWSRQPRPRVSVVVCSYNGGSRLGACLAMLGAQEYADLEVIVVDDGSRDDTASVAASFDVRLVRHPANRGLSAARNSGIQAAGGAIVAFTDDDCLPPPTWVDELVHALVSAEPGVVGVGGSVEPAAADTFAQRFVAARNPLVPLELSLAKSSNPWYRLALYLRNTWWPAPNRGRRPVYSVVGASMAFYRTALHKVGLFDERIRFGGDEEELCRKLRMRFGEQCLTFHPEIRLAHAYERSVHDVLRRARAYGRGNARTFLQSDSRIPPLRPFPLGILAVALLGIRQQRWLVVAGLLPLVLYPPRGEAANTGRLERALFSYLSTLQETGTIIGVVEGILRFRAEYRHRAPSSAGADARQPDHGEPR